MPTPDAPALTPEVREKFIEVLAHIYFSIRWSKINTRHNAHDVWNHRVRHCSTRGTLGEFVSRLSNHFGLQSLPEDAMVIVAALEPQADLLMDLAYREHIPVAMAAVSLAKLWKEKRFGKFQESGPLEEWEKQDEQVEDLGDHRSPVSNRARGRRKNGKHDGPAESNALGLFDE